MTPLAAKRFVISSIDGEDPGAGALDVPKGYGLNYLAHVITRDRSSAVCTVDSMGGYPSRFMISL